MRDIEPLAENKFEPVTSGSQAKTSNHSTTLSLITLRNGI